MPSQFDLNPISTAQTVSFNIGRDFISDANVRLEYQRAIRQSAEAMHCRIGGGNQAALATESVRIRNFLMDVSRGRTSNFGKAIATAYKETGKPVGELVSKYSSRLYNTNFESLTKQQQSNVWAEVVKSSGRSNPIFNQVTQFAGRAGRVIVASTAAMFLFDLYEQEDKAQVLKLGAGAFVGGTLAISKLSGPIIAGSTACGPMYLACAGGGVILAGVFGAIGGQLFVQTIY